MARSILVFFILACVAWALPAAASQGVFVNHVPGSLVDVQIHDTRNNPYQIVHGPAGYYLAGEMGHPYIITLTNRSPNRVLAVVSVDGVNVITGQTASFDQAGYIIAPYGQTQIAGWRKSLHGVAAFEFSRQAMSYASRTGRPDNVGIIGLAVFQEYLPQHVVVPPAPPMASGQARADSAVAAPQAAREASPSLGTGHGAPLHSRAHLASFQRATRLPVQVTQIEYDSVSNLQRRGVWPIERRLQPFPGFAPDPWE